MWDGFSLDARFVLASGAKQSSLARLDCFVAALLAKTVKDYLSAPFAFPQARAAV
jgi:hypothetical protein